jgi:predicted nucleotidyltransferase
VTQQTSFTIDDTVSPILAQLTDGLRSILREELVGIYLYGSLITGDFAPGISDIDLVVVMTTALDSIQFNALHRLHESVVERQPDWRDRLELAYITGAALRSFRHQTSSIGIISPGEPFHMLEAGSDWLISWYKLREDGVALVGPPIQSLIDDIPTQAYLQAVGEHICRYRDSVKKPQNKSALSYIVLTVARGLYTLAHGKPTSKVKAAAWARQRYPQWAEFLESALRWRANPHYDLRTAEQIRPEVADFVNDVLSRLSQLDCSLSET